MIKSRHGSAYVMVIVAFVFVITLVLTVLTVTAVSRNITARYEYFFGMYDLAVAGNEQAFFVLERGLSRHREAAHTYALTQISEESPQEDFFEVFLRAIMPYLRAELVECFGPEYRHIWGLALHLSDLPCGGTAHENFQAITTVSYAANGEFYIHTSIRKYVDGEPGNAAIVYSKVVWSNFLDYYILTMVELLKI